MTRIVCLDESIHVVKASPVSRLGGPSCFGSTTDNHRGNSRHLDNLQFSPRDCSDICRRAATLEQRSFEGQAGIKASLRGR